MANPCLSITFNKQSRQMKVSVPESARNSSLLRDVKGVEYDFTYFGNETLAVEAIPPSLPPGIAISQASLTPDASPPPSPQDSHGPRC